ncbi:intraflagellar transport protein 46 homolog isoform X2 [Oscarella lobularis]|uniref:intraflagellar transport protein 46 homolog isoform X2 n=1 Tax=Oscarella lobularis TaxID=121494 RepID=UPI003313CD48
MAEYFGDEGDEDGQMEGHMLTNEPYDEAVDVSDPEEIPSLNSSPRGGHPSLQQQQQQLRERGGAPAGASARQTGGLEKLSLGGGEQGDNPYKGEGNLSEGGSSNEDEEDEEGGLPLEGAYDPQEFAHLPVSEDIQQLFQLITKYKPQQIDLDTKLRPFIPDYIPTVGDIDAFLKVGRPDSKDDQLGLTVLDEPIAKQSDPTVLGMKIRNTTKETSIKAMSVHSLQNPEKNPKALDNWIKSIAELHRDKPAPTVHYQKNMPSIDELMQAWPPDFEEMLQSTSLPTAELDCSLKEYIDVLCGILDIPVYKNRVHSLHLLFSLYSEFKNSQHFQSRKTEAEMT